MDASFTLIGFTHGPLPENWHFWFSEPTDELMREFWTLVGDRDVKTLEEITIPGSWVEEIEEDDYSDYLVSGCDHIYS